MQRQSVVLAVCTHVYRKCRRKAGRVRSCSHQVDTICPLMGTLYGREGCVHNHFVDTTCVSWVRFTFGALVDFVREDVFCERNIVQRPEPGCVEALVAQAAVEALDMAVLHRPSRLDVHEADLEVFRPADHAPRSELRPVARSLAGHAQQSLAPARGSPGPSRG